MESSFFSKLSWFSRANGNKSNTKCYLHSIRGDAVLNTKQQQIYWVNHTWSRSKTRFRFHMPSVPADVN